MDFMYICMLIFSYFVVDRPQTKPPPGLAFIPHPNTAKTSGEGGIGGPNNNIPGGGEQEDTTGQSWIRKYWYVILPLVIANFMGSMEDPAAAPAAGTEGQAAPAAVAAAPAGGGGSSKQRRGKRT